MRRLTILASLAFVLGAAGTLAFCRGANTTLAEDHVVAGGPRDFMEVRHVVLHGTNEEIGKALANLAHERFGVEPSKSPDPLRTRAQRHYFERNYPILAERMRGVAAAFGKSAEDDAYDFSGLGYSRIKAGCSVMYFPPSKTADHAGIFSRDYDFSTGMLSGGPVPPGEVSSSGRPYVIEMHPDKGYASLAICAYDLLSGVLDGMNSEGLTVALLADDELAQKYRMEPTMQQPAAGLGVQQVLRFLLDTCATTEEAKEALLSSKQYYEFIPCHYIVADRNGKAFVWEFSQAHNREYIIESPAEPLVTTNFSLHRYLEHDRPPSADKARRVCGRYCKLAQKIAEQPGPVSVDFIKQTHRLVDATAPSPANQPLGRTLWHALYFPESRRVQVSFYLGESSADGKPGIRRSDYVEFALPAGQASR